MIDTSVHTLEEQVDMGRFELKLVDFGSAILPGQRASITQKYGVLRGATPDFAPPEMLTEDIANIDSLRRSPAVDVYAAASVIFLLLDGHAPFDFERQGRGRSYYLQKTERRPRRLTSAHRASGNIVATLGREAQTARLVKEAVARCGRRPSDRELARILSMVDDQLESLLLACLNPVQALRPSAGDVEKALSRFVDSYRANIRNGFWGCPVTPCVDIEARHQKQDAGTGSSGHRRAVVAAGATLALAAAAAIITLIHRKPRS